MKAMDCEESTMDDFTAELLLVLGYEMEQTVIHMWKNIQLGMCGQQMYVKTDVCILDVDSELLLAGEGHCSSMADTSPIHLSALVYR